MTTTEYSPRITTRTDNIGRNNGPVGDLTDKQYAALEEVARLSPGYYFEVVCYEQYEGHNGSSATHVKVWSSADRDQDCVALVGRDCAQYYDGSKVTEQVVKRVAHRVYRVSGLNFFAP